MNDWPSGRFALLREFCSTQDSSNKVWHTLADSRSRLCLAGTTFSAASPDHRRRETTIEC